METRGIILEVCINRIAMEATVVEDMAAGRSTATLTKHIRDASRNTVWVIKVRLTTVSSTRTIHVI